MNQQLQVHPDTCRDLEGRSITVHVAETCEAVKIYNDLAERALVAGLFHSTRCFRSIGVYTPSAAEADGSVVTEPVPMHAVDLSLRDTDAICQLSWPDMAFANRGHTSGMATSAGWTGHLGKRSRPA